jgi:hypothetical protein
LRIDATAAFPRSRALNTAANHARIRHQIVPIITKVSKKKVQSREFQTSAASRIGSGSLRFASFRAVKENPKDEIITKVLEPMRHLRFDKNEIAWTNGTAFIPAEEVTATSEHDVNFIARVRSLQIGAARRIKFHLQAGVLPQQNRSLLLFFRQALKGLCD